MIPELPATYVDHLVAPHGMGDVDGANAAGEVGSMVGGLGVRVTLAYDACSNGDARICRAAGRAFGSAAPVAPLSWLASRVEGQTWDEAGSHTADSVLAALCDGGTHELPEAVQRAAAFAVKALRRALGIAQQGTPSDPTGDGILVCRCLGVGDRTIRAVIQAGAGTPEEVGDASKACTGCRSCRPDVLALIHEETAGAGEPPDEGLDPIVRITLARVGPLLRGLGMPLEGVRLDGGVVLLGLGQPEEGAAVSPIGAVALARHMLRELIGDEVRVAPQA